MTRRAPQTTSLTIRGPLGPLEARLDEPFGSASALAVVCHPHPLHGGTMDNKVVHTLARSFVRLGARTLRFNFRGVEGSAGHYDEGDGEVDDAVAAAEWIQAAAPSAGPLYLAGFSFGANVALRAASRLECAGLVTVAPPVDRLPASFAPPACPWLVVLGNQDEIVDSAAVARWARALDDVPEIACVPAAGHFFHGCLTELAALVEAFFVEGRAPVEASC